MDKVQFAPVNRWFIPVMRLHPSQLVRCMDLSRVIWSRTKAMVIPTWPKGDLGVSLSELVRLRARPNYEADLLTSNLQSVLGGDL